MKGGVIIADAGGNKTDWIVLSTEGETLLECVTPGMNASVMSEDQLAEAFVCFKQNLGEKVQDDEFQLYFYGAGCNSDLTREKLSSSFNRVFGNDIVSSFFASDLEGAAKALFGNEAGIACILGTGSASGFYNGKKIEDNVPSLGYILGDEGSGAVMGKALINSYFKRNLTKKTCRDLEQFVDMSIPNIIKNVYNNAQANKFLANFVPFLDSYKDSEDVARIISDSLRLFFERNIMKYDLSQVDKIRFVGSVAFIFSDFIKPLASEYGLLADKFLQRPVNAIANYHKNHC